MEVAREDARTAGAVTRKKAAKPAPLLKRLRERQLDLAGTLFDFDSVIFGRAADAIEALVKAIKAIDDAEEAVTDVEEYDLAATQAKRDRARKKLQTAWRSARAAIAKTEGR